MAFVLVPFRLCFHFDHNVICHFYDKVQVNVILVSKVEIKVYVFVENWVAYVEIKVAIDMKAYSEGRFAIGLQLYHVLWHSYLLDSKT